MTDENELSAYYNTGGGQFHEESNCVFLTTVQ